MARKAKIEYDCPMSSIKWKVLESKEIFSAGLFRLRTDRCQLPDGRVMPRYYVMEFSDWVHIVPVTKQLQVVMVKQYRHAGEDHFFEVPGGAIEPGKGESSEVAAVRELKEETGYVPETVQFLGSHYPNPALQSNQMHTYLALGCEKICEQDLDAYEDVEVVLVDIKELLHDLRTGKIRHSLMMSSLALAAPYLEAF